MIRLLFLVLIVFFSLSSLWATHLDIRLFYGKKITKVDITVHAGNYNINADGNPIEQAIMGDVVNVIAIGNQIEITTKTQTQRYSNIQINGFSFINSLVINALQPSFSKVNYDDDLYIKAVSGQLYLINHVELEHYVAGVVQSESGASSKNIEYFFVQSIISRTYALVHYQNHKNEGFNLCDGVHCQVYRGRSKSADITRAVARTNGDVIVDQNKKMISAAFHSNCGGQTANSEDVWSVSRSYLRSVSDSFCTHEVSASWKTTISLTEFNNFLVKYKQPPYQPTDSLPFLFFSQPLRKSKGPGNIPLTAYRSYFGLRSTFFDIQMDNGKLIFIGRGYGHGVGLCQQGAIAMIRAGHDYKEVIKYYYTDVQIIHYSELNYNFMP